ncbi:MAG: phospho-N-acetylmuramoyl-pentapeptide-transferase [Ruminococcaceae bacterium]|nr:phospho-N-acetylmuramoyl-pentapeptide-transferase [Oscillospiraceae bacterium]
MSACRVYLISLGLTFICTVLLTKMIIPLLTKKRIGQKILDIGPNWHKAKEGTPTMGGIAFILASIISFVAIMLIFGKALDKRDLFCLINVFAYGVLNCLVGLIDDIAKYRKAKNEGLTPAGKLALQSICAILFLIAMGITVGVSTTVKIPFTDIELEIGFFYYILSFLILCGIVNAVNLTDGIDGLASTCVLTVGMFFSFVGLAEEDSISLSFFGAILIGATVGFLIYNLHPAKIFMGDTGSLFLGAIVVGASFILDNPILVIIYGFIFICEAISDILQVGYFKLTKGKRLFKMAPIHHHLEKCGFSEMKIVSVFGVISAVFCILAYIGMVVK